MRAALRLPFSMLLLAALAPAQHRAPDPGHSQHGTTFDAGPRQAAFAMPGMSAQVHLPIAGLSPEAQVLFDQGLCQLHGFWFFEGERSFRQVAKLHPECAMAYWGMAMCNAEAPERAAGFAARAVARSAAAPRHEQLYVDALAGYYQIDDTARSDLRSAEPGKADTTIQALVQKNRERPKELRERLGKQFVKDLGAVVHEFPDDLEAKALLAVQIWHLYDWGGGVPIVSHVAVDALLDQVFAKAPLHPAHHYRVHLWDQERGERALPSAAVIGQTAPGIAHQWHMAGHIYAGKHRHFAAAWQQEASGRVDHAHQLRDRVMPFLIHNYGHNQEWLSRSLAHVGRFDAALAVAKNLAELPRHPEWNDLGNQDSIAGYARTRLVSLCEDHEAWATLLELAADGHLEASEAPAAEVVRLGGLARACYRLGRRQEADRYAAAVKDLLPKARAERAKQLDQAEDRGMTAGADRPALDRSLEEATRRGTDVVRAVLDLQKELDGERRLAEGDAKGAAALFAALEGFPKTLLADAWLAAGEPAKAIEILAAEHKAHPNRAAIMLRLLAAYGAAAAEPAHQEAARTLRADCLTALDCTALAASPLFVRLGGLASLGADAATEPAAGASAETARCGDDFGTRPPLATLGPAHWQPWAAPTLDLPSTTGGQYSLANQRGRPTLVVFYLGFGCMHCVEQLRALAPRTAEFAAAGIDLVAIGTDDPSKASAGAAELPEAERPPFPLLADPRLEAFRTWRCHDDFESVPLHGTFLVDGAGRVRWQDVGAEPFVQFEWLLAESKRLLALQPPATAAKQ
ncbi:MAG: redoxin domain-containing protein [Planctomycetes bacterium]|nr:redoxin domain-containing protein [Planctomycetota bacterium]